MKTVFFCLYFIIGVSTSVLAARIDQQMGWNQKKSDPIFPVAEKKNFAALCERALSEDDLAAKTELVNFQIAHLQQVYKTMLPLNGLFFSDRKPFRGYESADKNYAVNIDSFFKATSGKIRITKKNFIVTALTGEKYTMIFPEVKNDQVTVKNGSVSEWIPMVQLEEKDRNFIWCAAADEAFKSSLSISVEDVIDEFTEKMIRNEESYIDKNTGEHVQGSFEMIIVKGISRKIVLENKSNLFLYNIAVEHQTSISQNLMYWPKKFPTSYRVVDLAVIPVLKPGERKEIKINIPDIINAKTEDVEGSEYYYFINISPDKHQKSEGRVEGTSVRVHRFTPYGERLTREYKTAGTPSTPWENVAPTSAKF